ncbi:GTP-binding protein Era [Candidatus Koribacter versatilis Ellin345]|uniref:GTPase Era n=1 Tax=Koribacter versatilis (strain Ellin345) TaxID=204669 RepID=Q1IKR4_KORVE|nr:GTPase Era [Candidatus Koribacter versatilis]ABF42536.1 GTP-binding protein Era [Candidatus Koribacter versatilis Ellin345]
MPFRSGFVSIIGRPNAGKSTLLNALVGEKIAIVTHKPQTTRNRIQGIVTVPKKGQIVLVDTPGVHKPDKTLNKRMMQEVYDALEGCDLLLYIHDVTHKFEKEDEYTLSLVKKTGQPVMLLLNKIDLIAKPKLLEIITQFSTLHDFKEIIPISAAKGSGLDILRKKVLQSLPVGPHYFPDDQITDQPERFLAAEIIREQVLVCAHQEVPYATTVMVEQWEEKRSLTKIAAAIFVERDGQKAIIIGRGGESLKRIGTNARRELEKILNTKVFLELFVKVQAGWRDSRHFVDQLDWHRQLEELSTSLIPDRDAINPKGHVPGGRRKH